VQQSLRTPGTACHLATTGLRAAGKHLPFQGSGNQGSKTEFETQLRGLTCLKGSPSPSIGPRMSPTHSCMGPGPWPPNLASLAKTRQGGLHADVGRDQAEFRLDCEAGNMPLPCPSLLGWLLSALKLDRVFPKLTLNFVFLKNT
jgi:hypothetical protein